MMQSAKSTGAIKSCRIQVAANTFKVTFKIGSKYQGPSCFLETEKDQTKSAKYCKGTQRVLDLLPQRRAKDCSAAMKSSEISLMGLAVHFTWLNAPFHTTRIKGIPYWFWTHFDLMDMSRYIF